MTAAMVRVGGWCVNCGDIDPTTDGKCPRCGFRVVVGANQDTLDRDKHLLPTPLPTANGHTPANPRQPAVFALPRSKQTTAFLDQARVLRDSFLASAKSAEARAHAATAEAERFRKAASVFAQLLEQVGIEAENATPVAIRRKSPPPLTRWAKFYDACIDCGTTERKHLAKGRCMTCDSRYRTQGKSS